MKRLLIALALLNAIGAGSINTTIEAANIEADIAEYAALKQNIRIHQQLLDEESKRFRQLRDPNQANESLKRILALSQALQELEAKRRALENLL